MSYDPKKHLMLIKGKEYLPVKERLIWWREEHPNGSISTEIVHADYERNYYVCKATVSWADDAGHLISATGHKSESVKDFGEPMEKAETGAIGRALAMLGYGTQFAHEFDEGARIVDSPVDQRPTSQATQRPQAARTQLAVVRQPPNVGEIRAQVVAMLAGDADALARLPKTPQEMNLEELSKTLSWLTRRARALGRDTDPVTTATAAASAPQVEAVPDTQARRAALNGFVDGAVALFEAMKGTRGKLTAQQTDALGKAYQQGQMLLDGAVATKASEIPPTELAGRIKALQDRAGTELRAGETPATVAADTQEAF